MPHSPPYFLNTMTKEYSIYEYEHYVNRKYGHYVNHNIVMINVDTWSHTIAVAVP